jgi:aspartyl-tRNA(Asn)/glutamyl-tRNA(Gln) amidotransferase subunit B
LSELGILPERVAEIAKLIDANKLAPSAVGPIFDKLMEEDAPAEQIAKSLNLIQTSDAGETDAAIDEVLAKNPPALADFKAGKQAAMGALVGMVMKSRKGLNPKLVQERLRQKLGA